MRKNNYMKKAAISALVGTLAFTALFPARVRADEVVDHVSDDQMEDIEPDQDPPVIKAQKVVLENQAGEYGTGAVITIEAEDSGTSGLAEKAYSFNENDWQEDNTFHVEADGKVLFSIRDAAGNIVDGQAEVRGIDRDAPVITVTEKENDTKNGMMKLEIKAEDNGSGITTLSWKNDQTGASEVIQENGNGQKSVCKEVTIDSNGDYTFFTEDALHNRSSYTVKVINIKKEDNREKERKKESDKEKENDKAGERKDAGENINIVSSVTPPTGADTEPDHKNKDDETAAAVTVPKEKEKKKGHAKVTAGNKGNLSGTEERNSFGQRWYTGSGNAITYSFWNGEDEEYDAGVSENIINTTGYYADSNDKWDFSEGSYFEDTEDELDNIDFDQTEGESEKKSVAGMVVGGVMILMLSAVSVYILLKKEIIKMPNDGEVK